MFLSADELKLAYGVDLRIGKVYVDRKVPVGNAYWEGRRLYMPPVTGFLFMPIFSDLCRRCGLPLETLLSEAYLRLAEGILASAARLEAGTLTWDEHVAECLHLPGPTPANPAVLADLTHYLQGDLAKASVALGTPYPSLNRADTYLVLLCAIPFDAHAWVAVTRAWYALMAYFLILDDLADIREDLQEQQENALVDAGLTEEGVAGIQALIDSSCEEMERINPVMANRMDHKRSTLNVRGLVQAILSEKG